ncbi:HD domain-containing protein [Pleurocapsales cyanobacterium LEGE 10410]|nr:HD domain-containing protein [Pleurocapsales cyanobacterium LEGE 10410]
MLDKAIEIAKIAHKGQVDKGGQPYIDHPLRVMNNLETVEEKIVAVLHDAVEDSDLTVEDLRAAGFSEVIVEAIAAITKQEGEKRKDYLKRVMDNPTALKVKIADMTDNADISRIPNPTDKDKERTRIYKKNILKLEKKLQEYA